MKKLKLSIAIFLLMYSSLFAQETNQALNFDGVNDYVNMNDVMNDLTLPFTVSAWVYWRGTTTNGQFGIVTSDNDPEFYYHGYALTVIQSGSVSIRIGNGGIAAPWSRRGKTSPDSVVKKNVWTHIAVVVTGINDMSIFINGEDVGGTYAGTATNMSTSAHPFIIGRHTYTTSPGEDWFFNGSIDEVCIWKTARTQAQIQFTMNRILGPEYYTSLDSGLIAYWRFDELEDLGINGGGADDVRDLAVFHQHGDCVNGPVLVKGTPTLSGGTTLSIYPNRGGNTGSVTTIIQGRAIDSVTQAMLVNGGQIINGESLEVIEAGNALRAKFDLEGKSTGSWNLIVVRINGSSDTLSNGFTIEEGEDPDIWVDIIGRNVIRVGRPNTFTILYGNSGNVDAAGAMIYITGIPLNASLKTLFEYNLLEHNGVGDTTVFVETPQEKFLPVIISPIRALQTNSLRIELTVPTTTNFSLKVHKITSSYDNTFSLLKNKSKDNYTVKSLTRTFSGLNTMETYLEQTSNKYPVGSEPDQAALRDILYLANFYTYIIPWPCMALTKEIGDAFEASCNSNSNLQGWTIRSIEPAGVDLESGHIIRGCHSAAIVTSPHTGKHYYIDKLFRLYILPGNIVEMSEYEPGRWKPLSNFSWAGATFVICNLFGIVEEIFFDSWPVWLWFQETNPDTDPWFVNSTCPSEQHSSKIEKSKDLFEYLNLSSNCPVIETAVSFPITPVGSFDPNEKIGSRGVGTQQFISGREPLRYIIYFENLATATASAQEVVIIDTLDREVFDLETFSLGSIFWGTDKQIFPTPGLSNYETEIDLRPGLNLLVNINSSLDKNTGILRSKFTSLDPITHKPPKDPLLGFLPPNVVPPEGEGSILFTLNPKANLSIGANIENRASITFDVNDPILTKTWSNTIDNTKPDSRVTGYEWINGKTSLKLTVSGTDMGSGILNYSIYMSSDGLVYEPVAQNIVDNEIIISADPDQAYSFYSIANDKTGNTEDAPLTPDITTEVKGPVTEFELYQNFPNPFNASTTIKYELPENVHVKIKIYDVLGREIVVLVDEEKVTGRYELNWNAKNISSGVYYYKIQAGEFSKIKKLILLK